MGIFHIEKIIVFSEVEVRLSPEHWGNDNSLFQRSLPPGINGLGIDLENSGHLPPGNAGISEQDFVNIVWVS